MATFLDLTGLQTAWADIRKYFTNAVATTAIADGDFINFGDITDTEVINSITAPKIKKITATDLATYVGTKLGVSADAMIFKGTVGTGGTHTIAAFNALATYETGWSYKVIEAGTIKGRTCAIGDMLIANTDRAGSGQVDADWTDIQNNMDGAVIGPASATGDNMVSFNGTTGKLIKDSGFAAHAPVTVADTASINLSLSGQQVSADAIFGTTATTICVGNDARLSDNRTPVAHGHAETEITFTDIVTKNASTTAHGYEPKVTAPAAGLLNVLGVANGETVRSDKALFDVTAPSTQAFGDAAAVGSAMVAARRDHKHAMPSQSTISHAHGNITYTGYLGSTIDIPLITGTAGIIQAGAFATASEIHAVIV
jgi:hypothetical protein